MSSSSHYKRRTKKGKLVMVRKGKRRKGFDDLSPTAKKLAVGALIVDEVILAAAGVGAIGYTVYRKGKR